MIRKPWRSRTIRRLSLSSMSSSTIKIVLVSAMSSTFTSREDCVFGLGDYHTSPRGLSQYNGNPGKGAGRDHFRGGVPLPLRPWLPPGRWVLPRLGELEGRLRLPELEGRLRSPE